MQKILGQMRKAVEEFHMIEEGDRIAVALSGGKDSITLLMALKNLQRFYPKKFELIAITVNPGFEFFDTSILYDICKEIDVELVVAESHIKEIVFDIRKEKNPCSLCANLRRGILNTTAIEHNCNKIALGHNEDDVLETFLMNVLYTGNISTFAPVSYMDRSKMTLIRPLIYVSEKQTNSFIKRKEIKIMPKACPMDGFSKREEIKQLLYNLSKQIPHVRANMYGAIKRSKIKGWGIF